MSVKFAVIWRGVTPTVLETDANYGSVAYAINSSGQIVGPFLPTEYSDSYAAVVWNDGTPTLLSSPSPQYTGTVADSISDTGRIVGYGVSKGVYATIEWKGVPPALLSLSLGRTSYSLAYSVNDDGITVGVTECPVSSQATAVNNLGVIVGKAEYAGRFQRFVGEWA